MGIEKDYKEFMRVIGICFNSIKTKGSKEEELKKAVCSLLNKPLQYKPKEKPMMEDVINKMKEFEKEEEVYIKLLKELERNKNMLKLLMDSG